ncbi:Pet127-domain-containing protein [Xylaria sp. FL1777]|nr:Pet127-domain-containing protein [Xylaria sp. FL1777]
MAVIDYLRCCFVQRKSSNNAHNNANTGRPPLPNVPSLSRGVSGEDFKTLTDLRQKCEENTLSTAEARALLDASGKANAPLTPREIEELHRILSPPPQAAKPGTSPETPGPEVAPRTPTNHMLPDMQAQSDLFCLPAEVRTQIWRYAIGGRKIYLAVKNGKLVQQENMERPYWRHVRGLLSVPLICRKSYLESINLLYSDNTFGLGIGSVGSSKDFFTQADTLLLPQCIAAMTSLEVGFHLSGGYSQYYDSHPQAWDISLHIVAPEPLSTWNCVFKALAQMKQLKSLVIVVWASGDRRHEFRARESELMDIPSRMTGLRTFDVWLPWKEEKEEKEGALSQYASKKSKPYVVRRNFEDRRRFGVIIFAMLQLSRRRLCRFTSPRVCASCLATSYPTSTICRQRIVAGLHARSLSTTLACREATTPDTSSPDTPGSAADITIDEAAPSPVEKKKKKKKPKQETAPPETDTQRQFKVLQGALSALKNVLSTQGVDVSQILTTISNTSKLDPPKPTAKAKSKSKPKSKSKGEKTGDKIPEVATETAVPDGAVAPPATGSEVAQPESSDGKEQAPKSKERPPKPAKGLVSVRRGSSGSSPKPANLAKSAKTKSAPTTSKLPDKVHPGELSLVPINTSQPIVPNLSYGLERVLFNPGVYQLQDSRSRVYNFDPYLSEIMPQYVTSSKDKTLISIAKENQKKYTGSTSSMTSMLAHFHYLLSSWREVNVSMLSRSIVPESVQYTRIMKAPAATFLHWKDGTYAIDADKEFDSANILSMLDDYERYRQRNAEEAYHYTAFQDFMMRSQLDAYDPRTRAVISIRMDAQGYEKGLGYEIRTRFGQWASFEREYYDMIRSAFLKYSLQVRMGRMDGIFYIPLTEMDLSLHGTDNRKLGDHEFKASLKLLNELLNRATQKWPEQSLRLHFETRASKGAPFMYFFAKPTTPEEIAAVQDAGKASVEAFEKNILGLAERTTEEMEDRTEINDTTEDELDQAPSPAQEIDSLAAWQEARQMVEEAMGDDEDGVGLVREAIGDALEQSGILRARSLSDSREYVDALLGALIGRVPSTQGDIAATDANEEEAVEEDEVEESNESCPSTLLQSETDYTDPPEPEVTSTTVGDSPYLSQPSEDIHEIQSHDFQATSTETMKEESPIQADQNIKTLNNGGSPANPRNLEEEFDEDDNDEETSEAELETDIGTKEFREDVGSSTLEPLKSLIMRMAQRIDEQSVSDTSMNSPQDDASKLKEFERILGHLISQSRAGQDRLSISSLPDGASADISGSSEVASTPDTQTEGTIQPAVAEQTQSNQNSPEDELLALTLTIKNKVNGKYVERPRDLGEKDDWTVEYEIQEVKQPRARTIYEALIDRRRKTFVDAGNKDAQWYSMFGGNLTLHTQQGRKFREQETEKTEGQPVYMVDIKGPLKWGDVFRRQPKTLQRKDDEANSSQTKEE